VYKVLCFCSISFWFELCWSFFHESVAPFNKALGFFGYQIIMYLDDGWASHDEYTCLLVSKKIQEDLKNAGFVVNNEKSIWEPTDRMEWLGFIWDLGKGSVEIHEKKFVALKDNISSLLYGKEVVSARGVLFNFF
jgi:hypothetical protein